MLEKAGEWQASVSAALKGGAPLRRLRELLHVGMRMPLHLPLQSLRQELQLREWLESTRRLASHKVSQGQLSEALREAGERGCSDAPLAKQLRCGGRSRAVVVQQSGSIRVVVGQSSAVVRH